MVFFTYRQQQKGDEEMIKVYTIWNWDKGQPLTMVYNAEGQKIFQTNIKFEADFDTIYMFGGKLYALESIKDDGKYYIFDEYSKGIKGLLNREEFKIQ